MSRVILVTGANGFVGRAVSRALLLRGEQTVGLVRHAQGPSGIGREWIHDRPDFVDIDRAWPPGPGLQCDAVIHLAARVHVMRDHAAEPLDAYRATNVQGALRVARAARAAGAARFVYVSSIKAVAESSSGRPPLSEHDAPLPLDPYGISKLEAERALADYGRESGMEVVVVRPPLVYGPGVRANFLSLMGALSKGMPLPLGAVSARRSMIFVDNLADVLVQCALDPRAAGQTFHVADARDLSVAELVVKLAACLNAPARVIPVPVSWLRLAGRLTGRTAQVERLVCELRLDSRHVRDVLGWYPPCDIEDGLSQTAAWYRSRDL
ncbi:NAD-dependent epimerase/dehydratase family protein [Burkholderia contaminans]|uniref:NAD-dependent dehydratase n=3 Tax=Bacteria TaxID=2 RepID=A0A0J5WE72_BURCE|nr:MULTISPECIES: NAD-dependent epimerase/dehydratase family protein [Burkholderia cepacia complex]KML46346.1 NAD-dependent dehydratase [Burkholderia cepacia]MCA7918218.1 NAD-dependent epimerase/dehydratase family protein [Burkholderia contaminans]UUX38968.1 NAD-dependent epimerase/dehydratase family protein [Burkholderia contaminans]